MIEIGPELASVLRTLLIFGAVFALFVWGLSSRR